MHMADALVSAPVALTAGAIAATLIVVAGRQIRKSQRDSLIALMGVMGAFVFAAQMINFSIPGTGSSGHIVGGILLSALLGPWAGFITLVSVLIIQCMIFADGGLMALGCNIINMAACSCLVAYPLLFRSLIRYPATVQRLAAVTCLASVAGLELGAVFVTLETELSGITSLPTGRFLTFMTPIHLAIGIGEGLATTAILYFVQRYRPSLLSQYATDKKNKRKNIRGALISLGCAALVIGAGFSWLASEKPDGLEWSVIKTSGETEPMSPTSAISDTASRIQNSTAILPDYDSRLSGIIGGVITMVVLWSVSSVIVSRKHHRIAELKNKE